MSTAITEVSSENDITHGVLIDLTLNGTTYYISNCSTELVYNGNTYQALAGFLTVSEIQNNITNNNEELQIGLSAIPSVYISAILGQPIKGGQIVLYRVFFNNTTNILTNVYRRFSGIINNFAVQEDIDAANATPTSTHTITVIASNIMGILENKFSGRRTNKQDYQINYSPELFFTSGITTDPSMDRVEALFNASFDFGRPYVMRGSGINNPGGGGNPGFPTEGLDWQENWQGG
jgi:hypothetical protein